jgi:hypothetical protein
MTTRKAKASAKAIATAKANATAGWWAVYIPPFAKCAKDGAPVGSWLVESW